MEMTEKSRQRRAIVIGGSIAGLFVGAFLRRIGWQVDIYERSPDTRRTMFPYYSFFLGDQLQALGYPGLGRSAFKLR